MFRRIELIHQMPAKEYRKILRLLTRQGEASVPTLSRFRKSGLMTSSHEHVARAWTDLNAPRRSISKNTRFFFTEAGWRRYGRPTITACQKVGQEYRVIRIKEHSVAVLYRDEFQAAVRPRKKTSRRPAAAD